MVILRGELSVINKVKENRANKVGQLPRSGGRTWDARMASHFAINAGQAA